MTADNFAAFRKKEEENLVLKSPPEQVILQKHKRRLFDWFHEILLVWFRKDDDEEDQMSLEILYLAISIMDKYMETNTIKLPRYQLLGLSSLFLAWKFHGRDCILSFKEDSKYSCMYYCANAYTKEEFIEMEMELWTCLGYKIDIINIPYIVISLLRSDEDCDEKVFAKSREILWTLLFYKDTLEEYKPTVIASSVLYLSKKLTQQKKRPNWSQTNFSVTKYSLKKLRSCVLEIYKLL